MHRVMVVDDEPLVRTAIKSLTDWRKHGFLVDLEARNGEQALALLRRNPDVGIILLDIVMPVMNGIELLKRLRSEGLRQRVIVLSAHDEYHLVREAFKAGADDYVLKGGLDVSSLLPLLSLAASRSESERSEVASSERVVREEMLLAREELLRSLLRGRQAQDLARKLEAFDLPPDGPVLLGLLWIEDIEAIQIRYRDAPRGFFQAALLNTARQALDRFGAGALVALDEVESALFLFAQSAERGEAGLHGILEEIRSNAKAYLGARLSVQAGRPLARAELLAAEYRRLKTYHLSLSRTIIQARKWIKEHYADPDLGLAKLSERLEVSRGYLSSEFRRETGKTITASIMETRIQAAQELLLTTDRRVYEISEQVGYRNVEHFARLFRRATGRPPGSFARRPDPAQGA